MLALLDLAHKEKQCNNKTQCPGDNVDVGEITVARSEKVGSGHNEELGGLIGLHVVI